MIAFIRPCASVSTNAFGKAIGFGSRILPTSLSIISKMHQTQNKVNIRLYECLSYLRAYNYSSNYEQSELNIHMKMFENEWIQK